MNNYIYGSENNGDDSSGGSNTITNSNTGIIESLYGSNNSGANSSGGGNNITNSGTVTLDIYGSYNQVGNSSGGGNKITNSGNVFRNLSGSDNYGDNSSGGGNNITSSGRVNGDIFGSYNANTNSSSTGNTIINSGTVGVSIEAEDGDDVVIMETGPGSVGGVINGGTGTDKIVYGGGTWTFGHFKVINFESFSINATANLTLNGNWDVSGDIAQVNGGSLTVNGALNAGGLAVNSGTANINGTATVSGATTVAGMLNLGSGGSLSTASLGIGRNGLVDIAGTLDTGSTICDGGLHVNGTLNSPSVSIGTSGLLWGTGTINGAVTNHGAIAPGNSIGTLTINGSVAFASGSTLAAELASDGSCDLLKVVGNATINNGSTIKTALPRALYTNGFSWQVLSATGGVSGGFDSIDGQPDSEVLSLASLNAGNGIRLELSRKPYEGFGQTDNQRRVGRGMDGLVPLARANEDAMAALFVTMDWDYSADQIQDVLAACNPEMYDGLSWVALNSARRFDAAMQTRADWGRLAQSLDTPLKSSEGPVRLAALDTGQTVASEPMHKEWSLWARALGGWDKRSASGGYLGYDSTSGGAVLGADGPIAPWLRMGLAFAVGEANVGFSQGAYDGTQKSFQTGVYAAADLAGGFYLDSALSYSAFVNNTHRQVAFADVGQTATVSYDSAAWMARLGSGWDTEAGDWVIGPNLAFDYLSLSDDGFDESGADFLNLSVQDRDNDYWSSALGLRAATRYELDNWALLPRLGLAWRHLFSDNARDIEASFRDYPGQPFTVQGMGQVQDAAEFTAGLRAALGQRAELNLQYALVTGDGLTSNNLAFGFSLAF